jgi:A/G-specific adenine glycosylase
MTASAFSARVIAWQRLDGRNDLPWQLDRNPYRVWLSEVMLQQTQVATVLAYFDRFIKRFPDLASLAAASVDDVFAVWSGLGYYSRARNLHRCAQQVLSLYGGEFPRSAAQLETLPGIGRSTAAAIAAFCFGERVAILDGNVKRVLTRVEGYGGDLSEAEALRELWRLAESRLPERDVDCYTQGLMDLGATVCSRRSPHCEACPVATICIARAQGDPQRYPVRSRRVKRSQRVNTLLWLQHGESSWLVQRPDTGVWSGLWSLPEFKTEALAQAAADGWPATIEWLPTIRHALTHFDWELTPLRCVLNAELGAAPLLAIEAELPAGRWWPRDQALALGLPTPIRRLLA